MTCLIARESVATVMGTRWETVESCAGTLTRAVEPKGHQTDDHRQTERQGSRCKGAVDLLDCGKTALKTQQRADDECDEAHCELDDREHRNRDVHVLSEQTESHRTFDWPLNVGPKTLQ